MRSGDVERRAERLGTLRPSSASRLVAFVDSGSFLRAARDDAQYSLSAFWVAATIAKACVGENDCIILKRHAATTPGRVPSAFLCAS